MVEQHLEGHSAEDEVQVATGLQLNGDSTVVLGAMLSIHRDNRIKSVIGAYFVSLRELGGLVKSVHMVPDEEDGSVRILNVLTERVRFRGVPDVRFAQLSKATASLQLGLFPDVVTRVASFHSSREQAFLRSFARRQVGVVSFDVMGGS